VRDQRGPRHVWRLAQRGCRCTLCRQAHAETQRAFGRARAQQWLPAEARQQLLDGIYAGQPFRTVLEQLNLTPNQVWGLTRTDERWSVELEAALTASRRSDLKHGTNAAYAHGCVCKDCREHQRAADGEEPRLTPTNNACRGITKGREQPRALSSVYGLEPPVDADRG
jgi:hypothetical protein